MAELRQRAGIAARALELAVLAATRSGEVHGAKWEEFNLDTAIWTIPDERKLVRSTLSRFRMPHSSFFATCRDSMTAPSYSPISGETN
jgi:integrase